MKWKTVLMLLFLVFTQKAYSQDKSTGIGIRLGGLNSGLTLRHFVSENTALEGLFNFGYKSFVITGLYEKHFPVEGSEGLAWFIGGGAHLGFFRYGGSYYVYRSHGRFLYVDDVNATRSIGGLDGILGLNYKIKNAPIDLSLDIKPFVDFFQFPTGYFDGGFSFRFLF
jgi:hypothetical protein